MSKAVYRVWKANFGLRKQLLDCESRFRTAKGGFWSAKTGFGMRKQFLSQAGYFFFAIFFCEVFLPPPIKIKWLLPKAGYWFRLSILFVIFGQRMKSVRWNNVWWISSIFIITRTAPIVLFPRTPTISNKAIWTDGPMSWQIDGQKLSYIHGIIYIIYKSLIFCISLLWLE